MTLNQVIQRLQTLALSHKQIKSFYYGNVVDWLTKGDVKYVGCFVENLGPVISKKDRQTKFKFGIWFCDFLNNSKDSIANSNDIESDLVSIAQDYLAMIHYTGYQDDWTIEEDSEYPASYYEEQFEDYVGAIRIEVTIGVDFLSDRCSVPAENVIFETTKEMIVNNRIYTGLGTEGNTLSTNLSGKQILMLFKGDKLLVKVDADPSENEYTYDADSGDFSFGTDIEPNQVIQILNRNLS